MHLALFQPHGLAAKQALSSHMVSRCPLSNDLGRGPVSHQSRQRISRKAAESQLYQSQRTPSSSRNQQIDIPRQGQQASPPRRQSGPHTQQQREASRQSQLQRQQRRGADSAQPPLQAAPPPQQLRRQSSEQLPPRQSRVDPRGQPSRDGVSSQVPAQELPPRQQQQQSVALIAQPRRQQPRRSAVAILRGQMCNKQVRLCRSLEGLHGWYKLLTLCMPVSASATGLFTCTIGPNVVMGLKGALRGECRW